MRKKKRLIVASIIGLTISFKSYAERLSAEFTNAKLSTVVDTISQISNFNVIWDKDAIGQKDKLVSIAIRKPIEAENLFNLVLLENGLIPVKEEGIYKIKVADEYFVSVPPEIIKTFGKDMFDNLVSQVKKYASPAASIKVDNLSYSILVKDDKDNINRLKNVITVYLDSVKKQSENLVKVQEKEGQFIKKEFNIPYKTFKSIEDKIAENLGVFGKYDYDKSKEKLIVFDTKENITKITRIVGAATQEKIETKCFYARGLDPGELIENIKEKELSENGTIVFKSKETVQAGSSTTNTAQPIQVGAVSDAVKLTQTMIASLPRICITDTSKVIEKIKYKYSDYLLDRPYQIAIEARIVQVSTSNLKDLGIQWGGKATNIDNNNTKIIVGGGSASMVSGGTASTVSGGTASISGGRYAVDFPANTTFPGGFAIGFVFGGLQNFLDVRLSALQSIGRSKILSKPQIVTIDGETAEISQGYDIPYVTGATATTPGNVQFKKATLKLNVTPRTTADGNIIMDLNIAQDIPDFAKSINGNPSIQTKTVTSKVVAKDGSVIVIGGILEKMEDVKDSGVPGLMNIPILGYLFKEKYQQEKTTELLIFLSPKIVYE
jgi:type IV pilus assembly protein PilQ